MVSTRLDTNTHIPRTNAPIHFTVCLRACVCVCVSVCVGGWVSVCVCVHVLVGLVVVGTN